MDGKIGGWIDRLLVRLIVKWIDRCINIWIDRLIDRWDNKYIESTKIPL